MKALKNWFSRRGALPLTAYLLALAVWLVLGAVHFGSDAAARAQGRLAEETMAVTDWQLVGLVQGVVRTISYTAEFDGEAREMCLYYTTKVGEDYSADRRVFPQSLGSGQYVYTLPRTSLAALRLDPCSPEENKAVTLTMSDITLNAADTLPAVWQYFVPTWYQAFCLVLYPALAAAAVSMVGAVVTERKRKYVVGFGGTVSCVEYMTSKLILLLPNVIPITHADATAMERLYDIGEDDCLILYSLPRYSE